MLGILTDIVGKARSDSSIGERWDGFKTERTDTEQNRGPDSTLFQCDSCGTVFVAVEKGERVVHEEIVDPGRVESGTRVLQDGSTQGRSVDDLRRDGTRHFVRGVEHVLRRAKTAVDDGSEGTAEPEMVATTDN
jgi:hypothetical protein